MLLELPTDDLVQVTLPVRLYANDGTLFPPDPDRAQERAFAYRNGLTTLPKLIAGTLPAGIATIRFETRISALEEEVGWIRLLDTDGKEVDKADGVIITAPAPQAADLLAASRLQNTKTQSARRDALCAVPYCSCITVLLGYPAPAPEPPAYALIAEDRSRPLLWLAFEQTKAPERAPNGESLLIAQLGPEISREHYDAPDEDVLALTLSELQSLLGAQYNSPDWWQVKVLFQSDHGANIPTFAVKGTHRVDQNEIDDFLSGGYGDIMYWRPITPSISLLLYPMSIVVSATGYELALY
jgi:hypothetical protein